VEKWVTTWVQETDEATRGKQDLSGLFENRTWTSLRAWGESLLAASAERRETPVRPPLELRRRGVFATPSDREGDTVRLGDPVRLLVDAERCSVGRADLLAPLFSWISWDQLKAHLGEYGHDPDVVEEAISPTSFDEAHMRVDFDRADYYVRHQLDPTLLTEIMQYFADPVHAYLDSWMTLADLGSERTLDAQWEAVVPREAVRRVEPM
jgi:hypothetical protein